MKSITVHGIDDILEKKIIEKSKEFKLSQNRTVKKLLENSLSVKDKDAKRKEFLTHFGKWTLEEKNEFDERIKDLETVNELDWKS